MAADLERRFLLDVTASGHVFIRERGSGESVHGGLPVFSTRTYAEAQALVVRHCRLARDGSGLYSLTEWKEDDVRELERVADLFRATYDESREAR